MASKEEERLNLLATFHYVVGGLAALFFCFPLIHVVMGFLIFTGNLPANSSNPGAEPPEFFGLIFIAMGGLFFIFGQAAAWLVIYSGKLLKRRERHTFSFIMACILCAFFPLGTLLGVFTIIALQDPEVKSLYESTRI